MQDVSGKGSQVRDTKKKLKFKKASTWRCKTSEDRAAKFVIHKKEKRKKEKSKHLEMQDVRGQGSQVNDIVS